MKDGKVVIIDEFTGRMMDGRRWSDGLHQAVEAKEGVKIEPENQTLASITFQNYFRMYPKLSGMTGTAATEAPEFFDIYRMNVVTIPTNVDVLRIDDDDEFYKNITDKFAGHRQGDQAAPGKGPARAGRHGVDRKVRDAERVSSTRRASATKCSTRASMRARRISSRRRGAWARSPSPPTWPVAGPTSNSVATSISASTTSLARCRTGLSATPAIAEFAAEIEEERQRVLAAGGLFVLGTERHESRRIDNQLRGRSGRQGDPGLSRFYLSLDDDLLRIFGPETMFSKLLNSNLEDGEAIISPWISKAIETAQKKVEARNYDIRKQVVEFDDVMNDQRKVIYEQRAEIMDSDHVSDVVEDFRAETIAALVNASCPAGTYPEQWDIERLKGDFDEVLGLVLPVDEWMTEEAVDQDMIVERTQAAADAIMAEKVKALEPDQWIQFEKQMLIQQLDNHWKEHLSTLDALRQVIYLRSYAQKKPIDEYKQEAFMLFERLLVAIREDVTRMLMRAQIRCEEPPPPLPDLPDFITQHIDPLPGDDDTFDMDAAALAGLMPRRRRHGDRRRRPCPTARPCRSPKAATRRARAGRDRSTSTATG